MRYNRFTMDTRAPAVSVIIPCFRADAFIGMQLQAFAAQVAAPSFEILLVDNGRNTHLEAAIQLHPELAVRVIGARDEAGTAYARNVGIKQAKGKFLLFCDADDVVAPGWVSAGADMLTRHPAFSGAALPLPASVFAHGDIAPLWDQLRVFSRENLSVQSTASPEYPILLGCSFGMTRDFAFSIGGFDRSYKAQGEDNDLAFRMVKALGALPIAPKALVAYRERAREEKTLSRAFEAGLKHALLCARHDAWAASPAYQGRWVARMAKEIAIFTLRGQVQPDLVGRQLGVLAGRLRYAAIPAPPPAMFGLRGDGSWGEMPKGGLEIHAVAA